jgi:hypothetical protein
VVLVQPREKGADRRPERPGHRGGQHFDHGHVEAALADRRGDLGADEAAAEHDDIRAAVERGADRGRVVDRPEAQEATWSGAKRMTPGPRPGRDHEPVVADALAAGQLDLASGRVQTRRLAGQAQVEAQIVEFLLRQERRRRSGIAAVGAGVEVLLRQRRTVVGAVRLVAQHGDGLREPEAPQGLSDAEPRE